MFESVDEGHLDESETNTKEFHFYYDRQKRLESAPQIVKDFYAGKNKPVRGIRIFFTKQNRFITFGLLLFVAAVLIYSGLNRSRNYAKINGLDCELTSFKYEEQIYTKLILKRNKKSEITEPQKVSVDFYIVNGDNQVAATEIRSAVYEKDEVTIGIKNTDYEIIRIDALVNVDGIEKEISTRVKR